MSYDVDGPDPVPTKSYARSVRTAVVLAVLAVTVLVAGRWGWEQLTAPFGDDVEAAGSPAPTGAVPDCTPAPSPAPALPGPAEITVNVYNASGASGIAGRTGDELAGKGFIVASVANDPLGKQLGGVGEIRSSPDSEARVDQLLRYVPGAVWVQDQRDGPELDFAIGSEFGGVGEPEPLPPTPTENTEDDIPTC